MEHLLNPKAREIEISGIRKFSNLVAQHEDVISLTIGQPDFFTPHHVKAAAKSHWWKRDVIYAERRLPRAETSCAALYEEKADFNYDAESEIIITTGASQAIDPHSGQFYLPVMKWLCQARFIQAMNLLSICAAPSLSLLILRHTALSLLPGWLKMLWLLTPSVWCFLIRQILPAWLYLKKSWKASPPFKRQKCIRIVWWNIQWINIWQTALLYRNPFAGSNDCH